MRKALSLLLICFSSLAFAQAYPSKPIRLVIGFPPGGPSDIFGRAFASALSTQLGQPVIVENKPGAGGVVGMDIVAKSAPDGYTLGLNNQGAVAMAPYAMTKMPFNPNKDLALVTTVVKVPEVVVAHPSLGVSTLKDLIGKAKASPGKINYGSA
ncbi:MAG TPA: tripartite tricarboxylate transporter substrate-binding protein, partial [Burkholderiales bacterium]|nr:tripartite tricarboxylate transporter substrate-binding protein [Burkholderiales bacterium]